jgi:hypothetical protein
MAAVFLLSQVKRVPAWILVLGAVILLMASSTEASNPPWQHNEALLSEISVAHRRAALGATGRKMKQQEETLYYCTVGEPTCNPPTTHLFLAEPSGLSCYPHEANPTILLTMTMEVKMNPASVSVAGGQAAVKLQYLCCDQDCSSCSSAGLIHDCGCDESELTVFSKAHCKELQGITPVCANDYMNAPNQAGTNLAVAEALAGVGFPTSC